MAKLDPILGKAVHDYLERKGLETLIVTPALDRVQARVAMRVGIKGFLQHMGLDPNDPSTKNTPDRVADMFVDELCSGLNYFNFPKCTTTPNGVEGPNDTIIGRVDEMVLVKNIQTVSLCEHHFQTIHGFTHIAYIPRTKLLGLSKFARITDFFARRPQIQERMTEQVYASLSFILETDDIAVQQVCVHNCMRARGAMDPSSDTTTSKMGGRFMTTAALRQEFLHGIR